jgi:ABC-type methionine transport system ATPase subunit
MARLLRLMKLLEAVEKPRILVVEKTATRISSSKLELEDTDIVMTLGRFFLCDGNNWDRRAVARRHTNVTL